MTTILVVIHILVCLFLITIVLLQHGKGADVGATFGGSSQSLFGTEGPVPLMNKITTAVAIIFMLTSITLAYISANKSTRTVMEGVQVEQAAPQLPPVAVPDPNAPLTIPAPEQKAETTEPAAAPQEMPVESSAPQQQ